jgi:fused signal recognition particle receptor
MGMFDNLKKALKSFTGKVAEETTLEDAPSAPAAPPKKFEVVESKPAAKPAPKKSVDDEMDAEIAALEAEIEAELAAEKAKPAKPAPAPAPAAKPTPPPAPKPAPAPAPAPPAPVAKPAAPIVQPPAPKPVATPPPAPAPKPVAPAPAAPVVQPPAPKPQPAASAPKPQPQPQPQPAAPQPQPSPKAGKAIQLDKIDDLLWDLELSLLEADVAMTVVEEIKETLKVKLADVRVSGPDEVPAAVEGALRAALLEALSVAPFDFDTWVLERTLEKKPVVIMFVGVNGTGKTTSIGRIAFRLKENGYTSVMAAGDTFRAGAIQQLERHAEKVGVTLIKTNAGGDPAAVAFDAIEHAKGRMKDVVLLDTAGRMQTNTNLMDEMKKIKRVAKPDLIVFVGDSLAGNDAVEQATQFDKAVGLDAIILTKVDTDAKGGAALSIAKAVGKPILFLGVGQEYGDIVPYDPEWMVNRIFEAA